MTTNNWFLGACAVVAVLAVIGIIVGATMPSVALIVASAVVLIVAAGLFISGIYDRRHLTPRQRAT